MNWENAVEAISAAIGAAAVVGAAMRSYWTRREARQQAAFKRSVQAIVNESVAELLSRQAAFEYRQVQHLNRQDRAIEMIRRALPK